MNDKERDLQLDKLLTFRPIDNWHEDYGSVLLWAIEYGQQTPHEEPEVGYPEDHPGHATHWSPIPNPAALEEPFNRAKE